MKRISIILIALLLILAGCADERVVHGLEGSYVGTFVRIHPGSFSTSSDVVLLLNDGTFQGNAIQSRFPAICSGTYTTSGNRITFVNTCIWTADFDWTFILHGTFSFIPTENGLIMWRSHENGAHDRYELRRQDLSAGSQFPN